MELVRLQGGRKGMSCRVEDRRRSKHLVYIPPKRQWIDCEYRRRRLSLARIMMATTHR
jgi:hypothetical protein